MMKSILKKAILLAFVAAISIETFAKNEPLGKQKKFIATGEFEKDYPDTTKILEADGARRDANIKKNSGRLDKKDEHDNTRNEKIAGNKKATEANAGRIGEHEQLIYRNKKSSEDNAGRIENLDKDVIDNIVEIDANKKVIAGNTDILGKHGKAIDGNKGAIAGNRKDIDDNTAGLATIGSAIQVHPYRGSAALVPSNAEETEALIKHLEIENSIEVRKGATVHMGGNQVHGVAYGTLPDDAVNVQQLGDTAARLRREIDHVDKNASRGIAAAMASAGLNQASLPGKYMLSAGAANYRGEGALAVGFSTLSADGHWGFKGSVNANSKDAGVTLSVGYQW